MKKWFCGQFYIEEMVDSAWTLVGSSVEVPILVLFSVPDVRNSIIVLSNMLMLDEILSWSQSGWINALRKNLQDKGLLSVDRNNKATLPLTTPCPSQVVYEGFRTRLRYFSITKDVRQVLSQTSTGIEYRCRSSKRLRVGGPKQPNTMYDTTSSPGTIGSSLPL